MRLDHVCMRACMCVPQVACWTGVGGEQSVSLKDDEKDDIYH